MESRAVIYSPEFSGFLDEAPAEVLERLDVLKSAKMRNVKTDEQEEEVETPAPEPEPEIEQQNEQSPSVGEE